MSAWFVLSALGIYQVCPGDGFFEISMPLFDKSTIHLENGNEFTIEVVNPALRKNEKAKLGRVDVNDLQLQWTKLAYEKIQSGGNMKMLLTDDVVQYWGNFFFEKPPTPEPDYKIINPVPVIIAAGSSFKDSMMIETKNYVTGKHIAYATVSNIDSIPTDRPINFESYNGPFTISNSTYVIAMSMDKGATLQQYFKPYNNNVIGYFHKIPNNWKITLKSKYNSQYTAGGDDGIIDGLRAETNWRKGGWQGYQSQNFEAVIDLIDIKKISEVSAGFLQDSRSWILLPKKMEVSFSADGIKFSKPVTVINKVADKDEEVSVSDIVAKLSAPVNARYVKIKAINYGKLPAWHQGAGGDAFIFIDEISIK